MKCNQSRPGFELVSPCQFPATITITPRAPPALITYNGWCTIKHNQTKQNKALHCLLSIAVSIAVSIYLSIPALSARDGEYAGMENMPTVSLLRGKTSAMSVQGMTPNHRGAAPILEFWRMGIIHSLLLLPAPLRSRAVVSVCVRTMDQTWLFNHLLFWKPFNCGNLAISVG